MVIFAVRFVYLDDAHGEPIGALIIARPAEPNAEPWTPIPVPANRAVGRVSTHRTLQRRDADASRETPPSIA